LATLKQIERELDTMAEEAFVRPSLGKYRDRYWGINGPSLVEKEVRTALLQGYIRDEDQARSIQTYLDQIATGLRESFLDDAETEQLRDLFLGFLPPSG